MIKFLNVFLLILMLSISLGATVYKSTCPLQSTSQTYPVGACVFENGKNYLVRNQPGLLTGNGQQAEYQIGWVTRECIGNECDAQFLTCSDNGTLKNDTLYLTDTIHNSLTITDTTHLNVNKYDTTHFAVSKYDTTKFVINQYDTTHFAVSKFDTTHINVNKYDTTKFVVSRFDTITTVIRDSIHNQISLFDTTITKIFKVDTIVQNAFKTDTTISIVSIYDTLHNITNEYDTLYNQFIKNDTTISIVSLYDTNKFHVFDTITTVFKNYDTLYVKDTIINFDTTSFNILDSIFIKNKFFSVSNINKDGFEKSPILTTQIDTTVIPINAKDTVILYYFVNVYDKDGQFINNITGHDTLSINGKQKQSNIQLLKCNSDGYLISNTGRKLATGAYIVRGTGNIKVNGIIKSRYYYDSMQGYRRK